MNRTKKILTTFLAVAILAGGVFLMKRLSINRQAPHLPEKTDQGILVEVMSATVIDHPAIIHATGTIQPRTRIEIVPQVSGTVLQKADGLKNGGFVGKDEILLRIDSSDYILERQRRKAQVDQAALELAIAEKKAAIAADEWQQLHPELAPDPLAVHLPQLKQARSSLEKAQAELDRAELDLARTTVIAPFDGRVIDDAVDQGQYVRAGSPVATLIGTDHAEVIIPLSRSDLDWLTVPKKENDRSGSQVDIALVARPEQKRGGRIVRSLGQVDQKDRMLRVVALVEDPFNLRRPERTLPELVPGTFVAVTIHGRNMRNVFRVPEKVLRQNSTIHVMDKEGRLRIRRITVVRREKDNVFLKAVLDQGDRILQTWINGAADGMLLRASSDTVRP